MRKAINQSTTAVLAKIGIDPGPLRILERCLARTSRIHSAADIGAVCDKKAATVLMAAG